MKIKIIKEYRTPISRYVPNGKVLNIENEAWGLWMVDNGYAVDVTDGERTNGERNLFTLGDAFWYINYNGEVCCGVWAGTSGDECILSIGNVFSTADEARVFRDYLKARAEILSDAKLAIAKDPDNVTMAYDGNGFDIVPADGIVGAFEFATEEDILESFNKHLEEWKALATYNHQPWKGDNVQ